MFWIINQIENLWGIICCKIYRFDKHVIQYSLKADLIEAILGTWKNVEVDILKTLVKSMPERCLNILKKGEAKLTIRSG